MAPVEFDPAMQPSTEAVPVVRTVTVIMGTVVGLTFMFGFGNVLNLALRLGVPVWVAPLVAPAVDLSILGLLLGIRHLALAGATIAQLRPARRLLIFASVVTLALNVADPIVASKFGKAAFDAVGPLLLIGWAEVGPGFLQAMAISRRAETLPEGVPSGYSVDVAADVRDGGEAAEGLGSVTDSDVTIDQWPRRDASRMIDDDLLARARQEDARHWATHRRPISAETLRKRLHIGAARSRTLVSVIRTRTRPHWTSSTPEGRPVELRVGT
jgi:hypothetical protein